MSEHIDASELIAALEKFQQRIAGFRPLSTAEVITLRKAASLDPQWVAGTVSLLAASEFIQRAVASTPEELATDLEDARQWDYVEGHLKALLHGVTSTNIARRHRIGVKALRIYGLGRQLIRLPGHNQLIPFVERLREMNKLGKRKKKSVPDGEQT